MNEELKMIKKKYGEELMHLCRKLFPTILETPNLLYSILEEHFGFSKTLASDIIENNLIEDFKNYINSFTSKLIRLKEVEETPEELLKKTGYNLYECKTEKDIQKFKKYYKNGEELCTFNGGRLDKCYVFFAVKCDVQKIKREDFQNPKRQDEYGTSVISIQFSRGDSNTLSIKNRYNHTVNNPDATYGNNLDEITLGLRQSFEKLLSERGLTLNSSNIEAFYIPGYVVADDGKYYKYNKEFNGNYYCPGNVIIDHGNVIKLEPEKQELIDYFILDKENKTLSLYDISLGRDSFIDGFKNIDSIEMANNNNSEQKTKTITIKEKSSDKPITIEISKESNSIIGYTNENLTNLGDNFLGYNEQLSKLVAPNVTSIEDDVLKNNKGLEEFEAPNLTKIGDNFLEYNEQLSKFNVPNVIYIGNSVLMFNKGLEKFEAPNLTEIGDDFLGDNKQLSKINVPNVTCIGNRVLGKNKKIEKFEAPNAEKIGSYFLRMNTKLSEFYVPNLSKESKKNLEYVFSVVKENSKEGKTQNIDSTDIAKLDRKYNITTSEIKRSRKDVI